jgi:hypothetical protein
MHTSFGVAWLAMAVTFGLHVLDEASHDFLAWYNPIARRIRRRLGGLPFPPTFAYRPWLLGLLGVTSVLLALTPLAFAGRPWLRPVALAVGTINVANGLLHLASAGVFRRAVPGVWSAPVLLASALWLLRETMRLS